MQQCLICDGVDTLEHLTYLWSERLLNAHLPVAICRDCGYVGIHPKPSPSALAGLNRKWFGEEAQLSAPPEVRWAKWQHFINRIDSVFEREIGSVLDIGARWGEALQAVQKCAKAPSLAAIELVPDFHVHLRGLGATIHEFDIEQPWPDLQFDLIVFRHTLEHLDRPIETLANIAGALTPNGFVYIAVPNAMSERKGVAMRTDWFRPVHGHYFNRQTLTAACAKADLYPIVIGTDGELWGLFGRQKRHQGRLLFQPEKQLAILQKRIAASRTPDLGIIARILIRRAARRAKRFRLAQQAQQA